jgi:two-component system chemotaxis response regulator CheB
VKRPCFVAVGASGGEGLQDIRELLMALPASLDAVVMIVLHRASDQDIGFLREVLGRVSHMPVVIAEDAKPLLPGICYIGEPGEHLTVGPDGIAAMIDGAGHKYRNRTIDLLFNSLARCCGEQSIAVVLSGALDDGARGLAAVHAAGGRTMVLWPKGKPRGMQQNAIDYDGPIGLVGSSAEIAAEIIRVAAG